MGIDISFDTLPENPSTEQLVLFFRLRIQKLEKCLVDGTQFEESIQNSIELNQQFLAKVLAKIKFKGVS